MLYIVATPIGNIDDITVRAVNILKSCNVIVGEERRVASTLLKRLAIDKKEILELNEHTDTRDIEELADICEKEDVALISDCGTPVFADPGANLIQLCRKRKISVTAIPGASSLMTLLALSSKNIKQFLFVGFLPANKTERQMALKDLKAETRDLIIMDTPYRLKQTLEELASTFPNDRGLLGLNLTQESEHTLEGTFGELKKLCPLESAEFIVLRYAPNRKAK